jgi:transcriptional regulator GlxA family with amidase domain
MNRRRFLAGSLGAAAAAGTPLVALTVAHAGHRDAAVAAPLPVPPDGTIRTAFAIGEGFNAIDVSGAWEVFQDAVVGGGAGRFELYTVAPSRAPVVGSGGLTIVPSYSYSDAPQPHVVVIPAHGSTPETTAWLRHVSQRADLMMSVCTGAFVLADTGLLDGKTATTHHGSWDDFERTYPRIELLRGPRYVEHAHVASAGGLTSGIDLALRVVERYLGRAVSDADAAYMEYTRVQV